MARRFVAAACVAAVAFALLAAPSSGQLDPRFYDKACPAALPTIRRVVEEAVAAEPRMGASLLRLHFHDCFVNVRTPLRRALAFPISNSVDAFGISPRCFLCASVLMFCARLGVRRVDPAGRHALLHRREEGLAERQLGPRLRRDRPHQGRRQRRLQGQRRLLRRHRRRRGT